MVLFPLADGGDGFLDCMYYCGDGAADWEFRKMDMCDSLGQTKRFPYLLGKSEKYKGHCMLELASSIGLGLVKPELRNPFHTSSKGLG